MAVKVDDNTVRVERGDTLSAIARDYGNGLSYTQLANINNIPDPNKIYVGQLIKLTPTTPSTPSSQPSSGQTSGGIGDSVRKNPEPVVLGFGLQSDSSSTLFAIWSFNMPNFDKFEFEWYYYTGNDLNNGSKVWFTGSKSTTEEFTSTYSIPSEALLVKFRVKGVSKTQKINDMEVPYWTSNWSKEHIYDVSDKPPAAPSTPTVEVDGYTLTASLDNLNDFEESDIISNDNWLVYKANAKLLEFQVVKNDSVVYKTAIVSVNSTKHASFSCTISAGDKYKVRCRTRKASKTSEWSGYSSNVTTIPETPAGITTCRANSETSVYLEWTPAKAAKSYTIEYATKKEYFDGSDNTSSKSGIETTHFEITGIESGLEYFFRVKAVNDKGESSWSSISSVVIGKAPAAPTTWSSTTTVITGEKLTLYWVHNSSDSSSQTYAELEIYFNGVKESYTIKNTTDEDEKDKTSSYEIDTSKYTEGTTISWRVRTAGVTLEYGEWSVQRVINVYAPPTLQLSLTDASDSRIETLTSFPFYLSALAGPNTQSPIGYHISIKSKNTYETSDSMGNIQTISAGEEIYSKHFDIKTALKAEFSASNITLENNAEYVITCTVSMSSGLTSEAMIEFNVSWDEKRYVPNARISVDTNTLVTYIHPYCENSRWRYFEVEYKEDGKYVKTDIQLDPIAGIPVEESPTISVYTETNEQVFYEKKTNGEILYFCAVLESYLVEGVSLSVYRREFDGSLIEVEKNIPNNRSTFVTDPHPALDLARYRIVVVDDKTGVISYSDLAGTPIGEKSVVIQWDENWTYFETTNEDAIEQPAWSGSMLKLPYNIDVSDKHSGDVSLVKYTGRKRPVSYYGTQLGSTSSWKVEIEKSDKETLYAVRRLSNWQGDVYVREPSGMGYWANVEVSYDINHCELTVPVSFEITRVEGGL